MANLYKPKYKQVDAGEVVQRTSRKWYGRYRDHNDILCRVALSSEKRVAQTMLDKILTRVEQRKAGLIDPVDEEADRPIREHLDDYEKHLKHKENSPLHVRQTRAKLEKMVKAQGWRRISKIRATDVEAYLGELAEQRRGVRTRNSYLAAVKAFTRWLFRNRRLRDDPLLALSPSNVALDPRRVRRPLSLEEFSLLVAAAEQGPPVQGLVGVDRAMMYVLAAYTGLRKGEIGSLTRRSFDLDSDPPTVTVEAAYSKRRRRDTQVLHAEVVERMRRWLKLRTPGEILFPVDRRITGTDRRTAKMMEQDLNAARRKWLSEAKTGKDREKTDFLKYIDSHGRYADFHSNRHTFITHLSQVGVLPHDAQELARHSDVRLTMNLYTHVSLEDKAKAIAKLAGLAEGVVFARECQSLHDQWNRCQRTLAREVLISNADRSVRGASGTTPARCRFPHRL